MTPVAKRFFGHMLPPGYVALGGQLARPVTVFIGLLRYWDSLAVWKYMARVGSGGIARGADGVDRWMPVLLPSTALEDNIAYAESIGAESMFTFGRPPVYSVITGTENIPQSEAWEAFVRETVMRASGRIKYWELWNEPELAMYWTGTPERLVEQSRVAYEIIKASQPGAVVLSPSMAELSTEQGYNFADRYFASGGGACCDAIAFHHYASEPLAILQDWAQLERIRKAHNLTQLPVHCTEFNFTDSDTTLRNAKLAQSLIIQAGLGIAVAVYDPEPVAGSNDYTDDTMRAVADWLIGAEVGPLVIDGDARYAPVSRAGEPTKVLAWTDRTFPAFGALPPEAGKRGGCNKFPFLRT